MKGKMVFLLSHFQLKEPTSDTDIISPIATPLSPSPAAHTTGSMSQTKPVPASCLGCKTSAELYSSSRMISSTAVQAMKIRYGRTEQLRKRRMKHIDHHCWLTHDLG